MFFPVTIITLISELCRRNQRRLCWHRPQQSRRNDENPEIFATQHYIVVTLFLSVNQKLLSCFSSHFLGEIRRREREVAELYWKSKILSRLLSLLHWSMHPFHLAGGLVKTNNMLYDSYRKGLGGDFKHFWNFHRTKTLFGKWTLFLTIAHIFFKLCGWRNQATRAMKKS